MKDATHINEKNEINIPEAIVQKMGLEPGDLLILSLEGLDTEDTLIIKKA